MNIYIVICKTVEGSESGVCAPDAAVRCVDVLRGLPPQRARLQPRAADSRVRVGRREHPPQVRSQDHQHLIPRVRGGMNIILTPLFLDHKFILIVEVE